MDRSSELDAFKQINLSLIASSYGYEIVRKKSTRHSVLMASGSDKIIIAQNGQHYVYCSVYDPSSAGTAVDFAQKVIEPGCSLGRVRQLLRPFLDSGYRASLQQQYRENYQASIKPSEPDLLAVAARFSRFEPISKPHPYLCETRGIPFELLQSRRLAGRVLHCPMRQAVIFPHYGKSELESSRCLTGYEIKGRGVTMFCKGGRKGLWMSRAFKSDRILAVTESGLDALSYLAVRGEEGVRVCSIGGQLNSQQPELLKSALDRMGEGAQIVAAFDNDVAGDRLTKQLQDLLAETGRSGLQFEDDRPQVRGHDWNTVFVAEARKIGFEQSAVMSIG